MTREIVLFACSLWQGVCLLAAYDILRIVRELHPHREYTVALEDLVFWVYAALFLFSCFYHENSGEPRGYLFAGIFAGMALWHWSVSPFFVKFGVFLMRPVLRILKIPFKLLRNIRKRLKFHADQSKMNLHRYFQGREYRKREKRNRKLKDDEEYEKKKKKGPKRAKKHGRD